MIWLRSPFFCVFNYIESCARPWDNRTWRSSGEVVWKPRCFALPWGFLPWSLMCSSVFVNSLKGSSKGNRGRDEDWSDLVLWSWAMSSTPLPLQRKLALHRVFPSQSAAEPEQPRRHSPNSWPAHLLLSNTQIPCSGRYLHPPASSTLSLYVLFAAVAIL